MSRRHRCYVYPVKEVCNADCDFCFVKELKSPVFLSQPEMLSLKALVAVAHNLNVHGITEVEITGGGEPMLHPRLQEVIDLVGRGRKVKLYTNGMRLRPLSGIDELNISRCHWDTARNNEIYHTRRPTDLGDVLRYYRPLVGSIRVQVVLLRGYVDSPETMLEFVKRYGDMVDTFMFRTLFSKSNRLRHLYAEANLVHPKVKMILLATPTQTAGPLARPASGQTVCPGDKKYPLKYQVKTEDIMSDTREPGYHLVDIPKGVLGEISKIREEFLELEDAESQDAKIMALLELSDLIGAVRAYLDAHYPGISLSDLERMADITARAFRSGRRS